MVNRMFGVVSTLLMLAANLALLSREVLPDWLADDPPAPQVLQLKPGEELNTQLGVFDESGLRIGYCWTTAARTADVYNVSSWTIIEGKALTEALTLPRLVFNSDLTYVGSGRLDSLKLRVHGLGQAIRVEGEFVPPSEFPCEWQVGPQRGQFVLPARVTGSTGDVVRPFESLGNLYVGKSWRMAILDPLAAIVPALQKRERPTRAVLIRVTARETITHERKPVETFRVESPSARAWVADDGRVLRQEVELPLIGKLTLLDERYSERLRDQLVQVATRGEEIISAP